MKSLDLHGKSYEVAEELAFKFIDRNINDTPIQVITGNSVEMQKIVKNIADKYNLKIEPKTYYNLGCLVIK
tara:strand:+ start:1030 stop:1242 length:213 start_codon:yes stop_codon:yes gene_type:complete